MTDTVQAFRAGIDAVFLDNALSGGDFNDVLLTVLTAQFSNAEASAWRDAIAVELNRLELCSNPTYVSMRNQFILASTAQRAEDLFAALTTINALPETVPAHNSARLIDLRVDRDEVVNALARCDVLIAAEPAGTVGRLVKDVLRQGKSQLQQYREQLRTEIQNITGDPDS
jgi:hypothetical protein